MPPSKQYVVRVGFDRVDRKTGESKRYEPGDTYSGDDVDAYLAGVDDQGPLIVEKSSDEAKAIAANPAEAPATNPSKES